MNEKDEKHGQVRWGIHMMNEVKENEKRTWPGYVRDELDEKEQGKKKMFGCTCWNMRELMKKNMQVINYAD